MARYIVGIDLGTTNSAVAYIDTEHAQPAPLLFPILQLVAAGETEKRGTLPSCHYEPAEGEFAPNALMLPWKHSQPRQSIVGVLAREHGAKIPDRLISSAKSWLSHTGVDRTAPLLPWHGAVDVQRHAPADVQARYLSHIKEAWNTEFPDAFPLQEQDIILTVPASYDEIARELTVEAASKAGLTHIVLLEEPQAAFYSWLSAHEDDWQKHCRPGQQILVCDIGGGTSDFTLISVENDSEEQARLNRVRVGEHLILGGDNLDVALAHHIERQLSATDTLDGRQWGRLVRTCQSAKETLLSASAPKELSIVLPKTGSKLLERAMYFPLKQETAYQLLVDGFLPLTDFSERPEHTKSGFQEFGLHYAVDPAISKHLAAFLSAPGQPVIVPDIVLLNGGFFQSPLLVERIRTLINSWHRQQKTNRTPVFLESQHLDLAVAYGAAYYGMGRHGSGVRIESGLPHSYYIGIESRQEAENQAICLIPAGLTPGKQVDLPAVECRLRIRQPVEFPLFLSNCRPGDIPGDRVALTTTDLRPLPAIRTILPAGRKTKQLEVRVRLHAKLSEIGTLEFWCSETHGERSWKLQFNVRAAAHPSVSTVHAGQRQSQTIDQDGQDRCIQYLQKPFQSSSSKQAILDRLWPDLEQIAGRQRGTWSMDFLRDIWEQLIKLEPSRQRSPRHEACWLNAAGFCLRPGYGLQLDDWRVQKSWNLLINKPLAHKRNQACRAEWWIFWRRIAGGLPKTHQEHLFQQCLPLLIDTKGRLKLNIPGGRHEAAEIYRMLGALELLELSSKIVLGAKLVTSLAQKGVSGHYVPWLQTLGHIGGRTLMYGPLNSVVPVEIVEQWLSSLLALPYWERGQSFPLVQLARKTGDRYRDISGELREQVLDLLHSIDAPPHYLNLVEDVGQFNEKEQQLFFGEQLPTGLKIT